ncbi:MAG: DUF2793 domain-containing protein [Pseudolabrys sp.]|nr:DUF2793 domain-containing protein [Pseudolabrys sp.]
MPTPRLALPYIVQGQAQKEVTHNDALVRLDALVDLYILDRDLSAPPASPSDGDAYIVGASPSGAWAGQAGNIAYVIDGAWRFYVPVKGLVAYIADEQKMLVFTASGWVDLVSVLSLQNLSGLGILTSADTTNRLAVKSDAVLFSHDDATPGTGDLRVTLNKSAAAKDAGFVFQDGFSTRALFGLLGDDNFTVKVSPDGSTFHTGMSIDKATGRVSFPAMTKVSAYINYDHYAATTYVNTDINNEDLDSANAFASNVFTVPTTGLYKVGYSLGWTQNGTNLPASMHGRLLKNGATEVLPSASSASNNANNSGKIIICTQGIISLTAGDTLRLQHKFSSLDGYASANITRFWIEQVA